MGSDFRRTGIISLVIPRVCAIVSLPFLLSIAYCFLLCCTGAPPFPDWLVLVHRCYLPNE